ncbi:nuclear factor 7, brain-like [Protopterus annectens]|uniref:nuclear factor 7, brain-like n=1 Tax=Protopterus annectens TaxID=7888 RepID=UPI001CFBD497|nr:nuclear factor 7, brain-like [Protopterus annectens]
MASSKQAEVLLEELICPVCLGLLSVPVMLECGHNFCRACIDSVWDREKKTSCLECREENPSRKYTLNRLLANVIQTLYKQSQKGDGPNLGQKDSDRICTKHVKRLELFCESDDTLVCSLCVPDHRSHNFLNLQQAVSMCKEKLKTATDALELKLKYITELQLKQEGKISCIQDKTRSLEQNITTEFVKLYQFLQDKEQQLIQQLKEEANGILEKMKKSLNKMQKVAEAVQRQISDMYSTMQPEDPLLFLSGSPEKAIASLGLDISKLTALSFRVGDVLHAHAKGHQKLRYYTEVGDCELTEDMSDHDD